MLDFLDKVPSLTRYEERLFMYAWIRASRPLRVLEIGTYQGGMAQVIMHALKENEDGGALVSIDPAPQPDAYTTFGTFTTGRAHLVIGASPDKIARARDILGGTFDLVFIDGDHSTEAVRADMDGVMPHMSQGGVILLHDCHYGPTYRGLAPFRGHKDLHDLGPLCGGTIEYEGDLYGGIWGFRYGDNATFCDL